MNARFKHGGDFSSVKAALKGPAELCLTGSLTDEATQAELALYLRELHGHILDGKIASFTVDVRGLAFVNSSAIRLFVDLASRAQSAGYKLIFDIDPTITWHRLSFSVLESLAPKAVQIRSDRQVGT